MNGTFSLLKTNAIQCMQRRFKLFYGSKGVPKFINGVDCLVLSKKGKDNKIDNIAIAIFTNVFRKDRVSSPAIGAIIPQTPLTDKTKPRGKWSAWSSSLLQTPYDSMKQFQESKGFRNLHIVASKLFYTFALKLDEDPTVHWSTYHMLFSPTVHFDHIYQPDHVELMTDEEHKEVRESELDPYSYEDPLMKLHGFTVGQRIAIVYGGERTYGKVTNVGLGRTQESRKKQKNKKRK